MSSNNATIFLKLFPERTGSYIIGHAYIQSLEIQRLYINPLIQLATVQLGLYTECV